MRREAVRTGKFSISGVEVLRYRISLPVWEEYGQVSAFYESLSERCADFCETRLRERAEREFEEDGSPDKRLRFPALHYTLKGRVIAEDTEKGIAAVRVTAMLSRGGAGAIEPSVQTHTWALREGLLLPPRQAERTLSKLLPEDAGRQSEKNKKI